jgi:HPt (histidine-containing phosphotransfer) domain-containing protein
LNPLNNLTIDTILELADGDDSVLSELFSSFLKDAKELSEEINSAVYNLDWEKLQFKVHTLKGLSGTIGASSLFKICKTLNNDLKNGNKVTAIDLANSLVIEYKELADYIRTNYQI